ncbi:MAG: sodium:calcium antiporter [Acidimicrobiales bacterium]
MLLWVAALVAGLAIAVFAARQALDSAVSLARKLGLSPFLIGMTVMAIGTDLPEIANSITASAAGHGDLNVGDSIGSVVTQITLVLGILCFIAPVKAERRTVRVAGLVTVLAVIVGALLLGDDEVSRGDGLVLIAFWAVGTLAVQQGGHMVGQRQELLFDRSLLIDVRDLIVGLSGVAIGAILVVEAFTRVAEDLGVPEYATSFLVLAIGTSLPELFVDARALRRGENALALGDIIGSSFVDATVSLGIGPALFPIAVSPTAMRGSVIAAIVVALAVLLLLTREEHGRKSGIILIGLYAIAYAVVIV